MTTTTATTTATEDFIYDLFATLAHLTVLTLRILSLSIEFGTAIVESFRQGNTEELEIVVERATTSLNELTSPDNPRHTLAIAFLTRCYLATRRRTLSAVRWVFARARQYYLDLYSSPAMEAEPID